MSRTILAAGLALSSLFQFGCAGNKYRVKTPAGVQECTFPQGKELSLGPTFSDQQVFVELRYTDERRQSKVSAGSSLQGFHVGKENVGVAVPYALTPDGFSASIKGISINPAAARAGTPLLFVEPGGVGLLPPPLAALYGLTKIPGLLEDPRSTVKQILLHDFIPLYQATDLLYDSKRILNVESSAEGENLEERLHDITSSESTSRQLSQIESVMDRYPLLRGELKVLYDRALLKESFFFSKYDIGNGRSVYGQIAQNVRASLGETEEIIAHEGYAENYWQYLAGLYHLSSLLGFTSSLANPERRRCEVELKGDYLFLADEEGTDDIFHGLLRSIRQYGEEGFDIINRRTNDLFERTIASLEDTEKFREYFEEFSYSYHYAYQIYYALSPEQAHLFSLFLDSRGRKDIASRFSSLELAPRFWDYSQYVRYLDGLYDLRKKDRFPVHDYCDVPSLDEKLEVDLIEVVYTYSTLRDQVRFDQSANPARRNTRILERLFREYDSALREHLSTYPQEFNYFWYKAMKGFRRSRRQFVSLLSRINAENNLHLEATESLPSMVEAYHAAATQEGVRPGDIQKLGSSLHEFMKYFAYGEITTSMGFERIPLHACSGQMP